MSKLTWKKTAALVMTVTMLTTAAAGAVITRLRAHLLRRAALLPQLKAARAPQRKAARRAQPRRKQTKWQRRMLRISSTQSMCRSAMTIPMKNAKQQRSWDALTDAQKELVEGDNADPDYFGRDTGDAAKDDPRNETKSAKTSCSLSARYVLQRQSRKGYQGH